MLKKTKKGKKVENLVKLQIPAGQANPSPPVGPALGQAGLNIMEFCNAFNSQTANSEPGVLIPVVISVYTDKSYTFVTKSPPASTLLKKLLALIREAVLQILKKLEQSQKNKLKKLLKSKTKILMRLIMRLPSRSLQALLEAWVWMLSKSIKEIL